MFDDLESMFNEEDADQVVEPFDITDGSLSKLSKDLIFSMGVEWSTIHRTLTHPITFPFGKVIHAQNAERLGKMADRHGFMMSTQSDGVGIYKLARFYPKVGMSGE